jgi:hypothetical protein
MLLRQIFAPASGSGSFGAASAPTTPAGPQASGGAKPVSVPSSVGASDVASRFTSTDVMQLGIYTELFNRCMLCRDTFANWRRKFNGNADSFADDIAKIFNDHRTDGKLQGPVVHARVLAKAFANPKAPFHRESFDRFTGPALGDLRLYVPQPDKTLVEVPAPPTHSIWGPVREVNGRFVQKITGSNSGYVDPESLGAELTRNTVDLTFNTYTKETGIASWASFYDNHRNEMRSFAYEFDGDKLFWVNELMTLDMLPTVQNQLVCSVDFLGSEDGAPSFQVYAMHLNFDYDKGHVHFAGPVLKMINKVVTL